MLAIKERKNKQEYFKHKREKNIRISRKSFWSFCRAIHGYKKEWNHIKTFCNVLQDFHEGKLLKEDGKPYKKLMVNMPPRHYKTRTLVLFSAWCFGRNNEERIISTSYSDDLATEFSRYTRDEIQREKNYDYEIVFSDIFPNTKIKEGDASYKKWALEGQHFSYKGAGIGGAITGKGCTIGIIDDQIKSYEEAVSELSLEKKWNWYTGTFKSRLEEGAKEIICMTRWSEKDICGMIKKDETESKNWYNLIMEAYNGSEMLCPEMLSHESYEEKKKVICNNTSTYAVFMANYHQKTVEQEGRLYQELKVYEKLLTDKEDNPLVDRYICYIDTADEGNDYLCAVFGIEYYNSFYLTDVVYTQKPQEVTEDMTCQALVRNKTKDVNCESNNGGRAFARNIDRILSEKYKKNDVMINWFHQGQNKMSRILSNASNVERRILFPAGWNYKYPEFYEAVNSFQRQGKNKHDDAPDTLTGIIEMMGEENQTGGVINRSLM